MIHAQVVYARSVLTVENAGENAVYNYSLQLLKSLDQKSVYTANEFTNGKQLFTGPLARTVVELSGGDKNNVLTLTAANDYQVKFQADELYRFDAILSLEMDGKALSRRDKGPIWMIYPMSDHVVLRDPVYNSRLIWQLVKIEIE